MARATSNDVPMYLTALQAYSGSHFSGFSRKYEDRSWQSAPVQWLSPDARTRTSDPNWQVSVLKGQDASGAYFRRITAQKPYRFTCVDSHTQSGWQFTQGHWMGHGTTDVSRLITGADRTDNALMDLAVARLRRKIGANAKKVQVLVPIAELRQLRSLIKALAYNGLDIAKALIDIKRSKGRSAYQYAAHAWLQWSFAIKPTVADGVAILESIEQHLLETQERKFTDYGMAKKVWYSVPPDSTTAVGYYSRAKRKVRLEHKLSYRCVAGYKMPCRGSDDYSASERFGLEPSALLPVAWELTAFSWLFDYFTTIGDYLEDTFTTDPTTTVYCSVTRKYSVKASITLSDGFSIANGGGAVAVRTRPGSSELKEIERQILPNVPARQLRFKSADEVGKNAVNKLLNLVSVAIGGRAYSNRIK